MLRQVPHHLIATADEGEGVNNGALANACWTYENRMGGEVDVGFHDASKPIDPQTDYTHDCSSADVSREATPEICPYLCRLQP